MQINDRILAHITMGITARILKYLEYKSISKYRFYKELGFGNGFLDKDSNIGSDKCEKIITHFPDLSVEWLLTGKGSMLKSIDIIESQQAKPTEATYSFEAEYYKRQLAEKEEEIAALNQEIGRLKAIIENSKSNT